jgi:hypothetical protein
MNVSRLILPLLLLLALTGAPFGMGRMMSGHAGSAHQHHQSNAPDKSAQHMTFMICAACAGVSAPEQDLAVPAFSLEALTPAVLLEPEGERSIPLLPPPRA